MKEPTILVVDDNQDFHDLVLIMLNRRNYKAVRARDGAEGIRLALDNEFDLIISDVMMPGVDGVEFLTKLKDAKVRTRFIFMTVEYTDLQNTVKFVRLGACDVIHKPFSPQQLSSAIDRALVLESPLALQADNPSQLTKNFLAEAESIEREREKVGRERAELARLKRRAQLQSTLIPLIFLAAASLATVLFYRLGIIPRGMPIYTSFHSCFLSSSVCRLTESRHLLQRRRRRKDARRSNRRSHGVASFEEPAILGCLPSPQLHTAPISSAFPWHRLIRRSAQSPHPPSHKPETGRKPRADGLSPIC